MVEPPSKVQLWHVPCIVVHRDAGVFNLWFLNPLGSIAGHTEKLFFFISQDRAHHHLKEMK
jgi:hypothetical protein